MHSGTLENFLSPLQTDYYIHMSDNCKKGLLITFNVVVKWLSHEWLEIPIHRNLYGETAEEPE